jgi:cystathionine beta-lyase/cystathionine gamma-synthase
VSVTTPLVAPLSLATVYRVESLATIDAIYEGACAGYTYSRDGHPNGSELSSKLAELEGAEAALVCASGMGALTAALLPLLAASSSVALSLGLYGKSTALVTDVLSRFGVSKTFFDPTKPESLEAAIQPETKAILVETISNPLVRVADLGPLATISREAGVPLIVDHTLAPLLCRPLELGASVVYHSLTKLIGGHSDLMLGVVAGPESMVRAAAALASTLGLNGNPFECWLALRGLATLPIRSRSACSCALDLAKRLESHPAVKSVYYPGLASHPDHARACSLLSDGFGTIITIDLGDRTDAENLIRGLAEIPFAPSFGDVSTTVSHPTTTSHRNQSAEQLARQGITPGMVRISVGLEHPAELWSEFETALARRV